MGVDRMFHSPRPPAPSRILNCGEMVSESVLQQTLEEELLLEEVATEGRLQSPSGRKLLVAMKLSTYCQEILEWTLTELALPGDHILAFHVASCPCTHSVDSSCEHEGYFEQLANSLGGFLEVYEELCNLRQINLEVEILPGADVRKILVDYTTSHGTCTLILGSHKHFTVRRNKSLGRYCLRNLPYTCTVAVLERGEIILYEQGRLHNTNTGAGMIKTLRKSLRSFGRSSKKATNDGSNAGLGDDPVRPSDAAELYHSEQGFGDTDHSAEFGKCYFSDSSLFPGFRHSFQGFRHSSVMSSSKVQIDRADMFILEDQNGTQPCSAAKSNSVHGSSSSDSDGDLEIPRPSDAILDFEPQDLCIPGWPLMNHLIGFDTERHSLSSPDSPSSDREPPAPSPPQPPAAEGRPVLSPPHPLEKSAPSPPHPLSLEEEENSASSSLQSRTPDKVKPARNPLHRMFSFKKSFSSQLDRQMSIVDWALKLPSRSKEPPKSPTSVTFAEEVYAKLLQEIALDAFRASASDHVTEETSSQPSAEADSTDISLSNDEQEFSLNVTKAGNVREGGNVSLAQELDSLCSERKCITFVYEELEAGTSNFSSSNLVGRGGGSEVYKGKLPGGRLVAVKRLNCGPQAEEELLNDVGINTSLSHPHIVSLLGYCIDSSHLILVYDYLPEGNLEDRLHAGTKEPVLPWRVRFKVAVGTAKALDYLHNGTSRPVIHRDVKTANILLTSDFESQLSDFGLAKWAPEKASYILCDDILGTFGYLAPEYFMYGRVNNKTDVYAFGVVLLELISGRPPIDNTKPKGQENLVNWARPLLEENNLKMLVDSRLEGVYDVDQMKRMLLAASLCVQQSPRRRPQMSRVLQILCSSHGTLQSIRTRPEEREESKSCMDFSDLGVDEEGDVHVEETPTFGRCTTDIQTHLALALRGVDDDLISRSSLDHSGVDLLHHLESRFRLSSSLVQ